MRKVPILTIYDEPEYNRYRIRWRHPTTRAQQGLQVSYSKRLTKEEAYEKLQKKREEVVERLTKYLEDNK